MIFGINTTDDISKLLCVISRAVRRVKFETILKYHEWYLCQILCTNHTTTCKRFVIFTCRYFKLSWNTTALSQSVGRNFWCSSMKVQISLRERINKIIPRKWDQCSSVPGSMCPAAANVRSIESSQIHSCNPLFSTTNLVLKVTTHVFELITISLYWKVRFMNTKY